MARIPGNKIERLKTDISLLRLAQSQGYVVILQQERTAERTGADQVI